MSEESTPRLRGEWEARRVDRSDPTARARLLDRKAEIFEELATQDPARADEARDAARSARESARRLRGEQG